MAWANGVRVIVAIAALTGCFQDTPTGGSGGTTGGECPIGSRGCACTGGGGCDVGLECLAEAGVCIDADCTPGDGMCSCDAGQCADDFECVDDYCRPIGSGTTGMTGPQLTDTSDTLPVETFGTGFTSDAMTSSPGSTFSTMAETGASGTTLPTENCFECMNYARDVGCAGEYSACGMLCNERFSCFANAEIADCCEDPAPVVEWNGFAACAMPCAPACLVSDLSCGAQVTSSSS